MQGMVWHAAGLGVGQGADLKMEESKMTITMIDLDTGWSADVPVSAPGVDDLPVKRQAPKHIWLLPFDGEQRCWCDDPDPEGDGNAKDADEYIRADIVKAQIKAAVQAGRNALKELVK